MSTLGIQAVSCFALNIVQLPAGAYQQNTLVTVSPASSRDRLDLGIA